MKKSLLILFVVLALFCATVSAAIDITNTSVSLAGAPGQNISSSFIVVNTGIGPVNVSFTGLTLTNGSEQLVLTGIPMAVDLPAGSEYVANFSVAVPSQKLAGNYTGTLTATSNLADSDSVNIYFNVIPVYSVGQVSNIDLGSVSLNSTATKTFTISNTGNADITKASFTFSGSGSNFKADKKNFTISANSAQTVSFNITVPLSSSSGDITLGTVNLASDQLNQALFDVEATIGGGLEIEDFDVFLTTRDSKNENDADVADGHTLDFDEQDAGPGSVLRFDLNIRNSFTDDDDIDIEDITVKVTIEGIDEEDDIDEESESFDLNTEEEVSIDIEVDIPLSVEPDTYDVIIDIEGEDTNGNNHFIQRKIKLPVKKENRDVIITEVTLFPESIKCSGTATVTATIKNLGTRTEEDAKLEITNKNLKLNFVRDEINLEEDPFDEENEYSESVKVSVERGTRPTRYPITVNSFITGSSAVWDKETINLLVEACEDSQAQEEEQPEEEAPAEEEPKPEEASEEVSEGTGQETDSGMVDVTGVPILKPTVTTEVPLTQKPGFMTALILFNVMIIAAVAFFTYKMIPNKKRK